MKHAQQPLRRRPPWQGGLLGLGAFVALSLASGRAHAQADVSPAPPDILLLVDTSGSMDYKTSSNSFPTCHYAGAATTVQASERSRWIELVEVLTGSINNYDCQKLDRNSAGFRSEYAIGAADPYDFLYSNPYNRPASGGCVMGPGTLDPTNKALFPASAIKSHPFDNTAGSCAFNQASDGILDAFAPDVHFGLMTFDTEPKPAKDMSGLWSYYLSSSKQGEPQGCLVPQDQEVGVRNADAPPWEGRAVGFGDPALGSNDYKTRNDMIQKVLLATRPYGATPIAGMLDDARTYMLSDANPDPINPAVKFGPFNDPAAKCRHKSIILLSDGQPNMDLRPYCEPGGCPYSKAEDIAQDLKAKGVEIYVIGFALSSVTVAGSPKSCSTFTATDFDGVTPGGICKTYPDDTAIQACCALNRIAAAGGHAPTSATDSDWRRAHFADNRDELRSALSQAIGGNFDATTRTPFVNVSGAGFVSQTSDLDFARSFRFAATFTPGKLDKPWTGALTRMRYQCVVDGGALVAKLQPPDEAKGDQFVANVNASGPAKRKIFSVVGNSPVVSDASMRPNLPLGVLDGVGNYSGTMNTVALDSAGFVAATSAEAIKVNDTTCDSSTVNLNALQCRDRYLKWLVGLDNGTPFNRCPSLSSGNCSLISEIFHSVPRAVPGRPAQFLSDSSYEGFVQAQVGAKRPSMIYASSNDGFLHAFKMAQVDTTDGSEQVLVKSKETNELWTFVPPGVLPGIPALYPASHQLLLDGTPVIKEVVATDDSSLPVYKYRLERTLADARGGLGKWRTILVQSYGSQRPGYFAVDVTDPVLGGSGGPKFLWQLVTDKDGRQLFGRGGATPLITTVYLDGREVAVAVLGGGYSDAPGDLGPAPTYPGCKRANTSYPAWIGTDAPLPRDYVRCYTSPAGVLARSITVVRLDTGEILRTFRRSRTEIPGINSLVVAEVPLDSPMTGQPVAYPPDTGGVADRVFIGDQDGTLWRLNFASQTGKVTDWNVDLFFDGFPKGSFNGDTFNHAPDHGQPIVTRPIMSVNQRGDLTIAFSTGDQEAVGAGPPANYVWSLTEKPSADRKVLTPKVNWYLGFKGALAGDRVIGDMALFGGDLFFSTVGPPDATEVCSAGNGKVWGMHYVDPNPTGTAKGGRISATLSNKGLIGPGGYIPATTLLGTDPQGFLSGVAVAQEPTCEKPGTISDPGAFGYGVRPAEPPKAAGKFQLIVPIGGGKSTSTVPGITAVPGGDAIELDQPPVTLVVDSWGSIVE